MKYKFEWFFICIFVLALAIYGLELEREDNKTLSVNAKFLEGLEYGPQNMDMNWEIAEVKSTLKDTQAISLPDNSNRSIFMEPENYANVKGITTFRGNNYRNSATYGVVDMKKEQLEIIWSKSIGSIDKWTGVGWNGQPAIIEWDYGLQQKMNLNSNKKTKEKLREVIYATLDGKIYFLDLDDGNQTRNPINIGAPIKGSVSIDPRGYPLLYVGQGIDTVQDKPVKIGYRIFDLFNQNLLLFLDGKDDYALRDWGAFDSNPLIDKTSDTVFLGGENGLFYKIKLNTEYEPGKSEITINPKILKYKYQVPGKNFPGIENSVAIYRNVAYFADNSGLLQAININSLEPLWIRDVTDDTDSTITISESATGIALFTGCEVDHQGAEGKAYIRKLDALTGEILWENEYKAFHHSTVNGGVLGTPVVGKKDLSDLVIYNVARVGSLSRGLLVALDKETGQAEWKLELEKYSWSSPVDIYTPAGKGYLVLGDSDGNLILIDGKTGKILDSLNLGTNIEASPTVFNDMLVVGTRGQKIFGVKIK